MNKNNIKSMVITIKTNMTNHAANGGDKISGNSSSIKKTEDGRSYISGAMVRHALFDALRNFVEYEGGFVSTGDGVNKDIAHNWRADLGGYMIADQGVAGRRTGPLSCTPLMALEESHIGKDLLIRLSSAYGDNKKKNLDNGVAEVEEDVENSAEEKNGDNKTDKNGNKQALVYREFSTKDEMVGTISLDLATIGIQKWHEYEKKFNVATEYVKFISNEERKNRALKILDSSMRLVNFAQQANFACTAEPTQVIITFGPIYSRYVGHFFSCTPNVRKNILKRLDRDGIVYFIGDDEEIISQDSVVDAYDKAIEYLMNNEIYDPTRNAPVYENMEDFIKKNEKKII